MTNSWNDIKNTDLVLIMGGNAAEAHPCGFKWVTEAMQTRKAKLIVVDPRFTRSAALADVYAPIRVGTDIAFLAGVINYLLSNDKIHLDYVKMNTDVSFLTKPDYKYDNGFFSGYDEAKRSYNKASWGYQVGEDGFVKVDETLQDPLCVFQQMKKHFSRYTPELVSQITGTPKDQFLKIAQMLGETSTPDKVMTICYALGWTQHSVGSQNIRTMAMIQLLLGNMGRPGGGVNALRGHANVQGITDMCAYSEVLSGYMSSPTEADVDRATYLAARTGKPLRPGQMAFTQNFPKWHTSLMKAYYGDAATADNHFAYDWMPKRDGAYDILAIFERMHQGKVNGFIVQGFNPLAAVPNKKKLSQAMAKLKYMVVMDPLETETSEFWKNFGPLNDVKPEEIQTEVFRFPTTCFAEETGTFTNSSRVINWKEKAVDGPGESKPDSEIMARLFVKLRGMYAKDGGTLPEPVAALAWPYLNANVPNPGEVLREISGKALADVMPLPAPAPAAGATAAAAAAPAAPPVPLVKAGEQLPGFALLRDDGSTSCGNWIYSGCWGPTGNLTARRDTADPTGLGVFPGWGFSWPANRRILYNRASADKNGKPWDPSRKYLAWNGKSWGGRSRRSRHAARCRAGTERRCLHHEPRRRGAFPCRRHERGSVPRALRALRDAGGGQPDVPDQPEGHEQPRCTCLQGGPRGLRQEGGVPVRGHHLPTDGAPAFLDQALAQQCHRAAGALRRDQRRTGQGKGHQAGGQGPRAQQPRRGHRGLCRDQAHQGHGRQRQACAPRRHPHPLGIQGRDAERLPRQCIDPVRRRRQLADAGIQGVPGEHRKGGLT